MSALRGRGDRLQARRAAHRLVIMRSAPRPAGRPHEPARRQPRAVRLHLVLGHARRRGGRGRGVGRAGRARGGRDPVDRLRRARSRGWSPTSPAPSATSPSSAAAPRCRSATTSPRARPCRCSWSARVLAGQTDRIGSLVVNPGGPGGSGADAAIGLALTLPEDGAAAGSTSSASTRAASACPRRSSASPTSSRTGSSPPSRGRPPTRQLDEVFAPGRRGGRRLRRRVRRRAGHLQHRRHRPRHGPAARRRSATSS